MVNDGGVMGFIATGDHVGTIEITNGDLYGEVVLAVNPNGTYLPGEVYDISNLVTVDGAAIVYDKAINYQAGMLSGVFDEAISTLSFKAENNLKSKEAAKALKAIKGQQAANISAVMQQNNLVRHTLGMRLNQINRAKAVKVNVPVKQLTEGEAIAVPMDITVKPEYDMWAKISRNKGAINAASDYKTDAYSLGWDKQTSKEWRWGQNINTTCNMVKIRPGR